MREKLQSRQMQKRIHASESMTLFREIQHMEIPKTPKCFTFLWFGASWVRGLKMKRKLQDGRPPDLSCGVFGQAIEVTLKSLKMCGEHESLNNPWEIPWDFPSCQASSRNSWDDIMKPSQPIFQERPGYYQANSPVVCSPYQWISMEYPHQGSNE